MEAEKQASIRELLRHWYLANHRRLPWRDAPSLYKTVVSEFMLQQTQVVTVLPYFERWLRAFPTFSALAEAEEAKVLKHWEGLGYYSRARNLHQLAKALVEQFPTAEAIFKEENLSNNGEGIFKGGTLDHKEENLFKEGKAIFNKAGIVFNKEETILKEGTVSKEGDAPSTGGIISKEEETLSKETGLFQDAPFWQAFKGVGEYTSAAITSISFGYPAAVVDGNVIRILARLTADNRAYKGSQAAVKSFAPLAHALLDTTDPGTHNQAMMELGATVCFKRKPLCLLCPLKGHCLAFRTGKPEDFPNLQRPQPGKVTVRRAYVQHEGRLLFYQNLSQSQRLATLWEFPTLETLGLELSLDQKPFLTKKRGISHQMIQEHFFYIPFTNPLTHDLVFEKALKEKPQLQWLSREALNEVTLSGPHRKWLEPLEKKARALGLSSRCR